MYILCKWSIFMIRVTGGSRSQKQHVIDMINFCTKKLMPRMHLDITVKLKDIGKDAYGYCLSDDEDSRPDRPRCFELEIQKKLPLRKLLETIAHEMVHVKQYARGELYQSGITGLHRWKGQWIKKDPDYWDCPWEWEAMGRETALFIQYAEAHGFGKKKWVKDT